jgi:hypothetical protein
MGYPVKFFRHVMLSSAAYAAATMPAHAEPVSFAIFSALYTIGIPGAIANAISLIAIPALAVGASLLGGQKAPSIKASDAKNTFESEEAQVMEGIGRVRIGGLKAFGNSDGSTRARLVCRLQGPIDAVEEYFIGGREVTVEDNGNVSSPPWARAGGSWANWKDKVGTGTETAWASLMSLFPSLWTADHRVRGIAQSLILWYNPGLKETKYFTLYQGGVPDTEQVVRASKIYDPRDPDQTATNRSTWKWNDNGILACAHVLRRDPAFASSMFDWTLIAAQATKADQLIVTKTGTEKRSRAWGIWGWETARSDVMQQLMDSAGCELRITDAGKIWFQLVDDVHSSEIAFTPKDGYEITWRSGPEAVERPNICRVNYYSPERNYESAEIDMTGIAWASVEDEITRYGAKYFDIDLTFCPSASQAQRIARRKFLQARTDTGVLNADMVGLAAWGLLYGSVELPDLGDVLPVRMEAPRIDDDQGMVEIPFSVWPTLPAWNPTTDEAAAPEPIPDFGFETNLDTPDAPTAVTQVVYPDGSGEVRLAFPHPDGDVDVIEANFRTYTGGLPDPWQSMTEGSTGTFSYKAGIYTGVQADGRVRVFSGDEGSYFSDVFTGTVGVNNAAPGQPNGLTGGATFVLQDAVLSVTVTAAESRAASIRLERRVPSLSPAWTVVDRKNVRPGQSVAFDDTLSPGGGGGAVEWRLQTLTSDGTGGPYLTYGANVPPFDPE